MRNDSPFRGFAYISLTSAHPAGALQKMQKVGIPIQDVTAINTFTIRLCIRRNDINRVSRICEKSGDKLEIEGITGYIFYLVNLIRRPVFLVGVFMWLLVALWLPTKILFVEVSGANRIPESYILECAADCGIHIGATTKQVRSEEVKNALLTKVPELTWAGINTSGCVATISVEEKSQETEKDKSAGLSDILATEDAIVREISIQSGTALCQPGQVVKKGQALISAYRDNGQTLEFVGAEGEIYGETKRQLTVITPLKAFKRTKILSESKNIYLIIGKKPINFHKHSGILDPGCVKMYEVVECSLPGNFQLPITLVTEYITEYAVEPAILQTDDFGWLESYAQSYLKSCMIAGSVQSGFTKTEMTNESFMFHGTYACREMIAEYESKRLMDNDGENS